MRDLVQAAREGPRQALASFADLPHRHPFAISGALVAVLVIILGAGVYNANHQVEVLRPRVTQINRAASVCNARSLSHRRASARCATRLRIGLLNCRRHPACLSELEKAQAGKPAPLPSPGAEAASPGRSDAPTASPGGGDAVHQPSHQGNQQPGGSESPPPASEPAPQGSAPATAGESSPPPSQGTPASPEADSPAASVGACVNAVVGTCIGVEVK